MREIKFRAWDKEQKKYIYTGPPSFLLDYEMRLLNFSGKHKERDDWPPIGFTEDEQTWFDIEQFTGLKDCDGKDIYENDLLSVDGGVRIVKVVWFRPDACFDTKPVKIINNGEFKNLYNHQFPYRTKVIGTIHSNPELLEGKCTPKTK